MNDATRILLQLVKSDPRFKLDAYIFVRDGLAYAQEVLDTNRDQGEDRPDVEEEQVDRHLTGRQLCEALRLYALDQYGYMAMTVLNNWGLETTGHFGDVVYNMIEHELMKKSESDRREDFDDVYDFKEALQQQFDISSAD